MGACIYALIDPYTNEICYIGQTRNAKYRYMQHISRPGNCNGNPYKAIWIKSLYRLGSIPLMVILDYVEDDKDGCWADRREVELIRLFLALDCPLLNINPKRICRDVDSRYECSEFFRRL